MTYAFGGPEEYHGRDMWRAHEKLVRNKGLNDHHFDVIVKHLVGALQKFNVPEVGAPSAFIHYVNCMLVRPMGLARCKLSPSIECHVQPAIWHACFAQLTLVMAHATNITAQDQSTPGVMTGAPWGRSN